MMFFIKFFKIMCACTWMYMRGVCMCVCMHVSVYMTHMRLENSHGYWSSSTFHILFEIALIGLCCNL